MKTRQLNNFISVNRKRYGYIDSVRGLAVVGMIVYHLLYDILCIYGIYPGFYNDLPFIVFQRFVGFSFFIVSGISVDLSRRPFENGIFVSLCGLGVTVVTIAFMPEESILYGVLTILGFSMMLFALLKKPLSRINAVAGMVVTGIIFVLTYGVKFGFIGIFAKPLFYLPDWMYQSRYLAFLGFPDAAFRSSDYYPIFPWLFMFAFGFYLWQFIVKHRFEKYFYCRVPVLDAIGRHSLIIYLIHQPVLYLVCMAIFGY